MIRDPTLWLTVPKSMMDACVLKAVNEWEQQRRLWVTREKYACFIFNTLFQHLTKNLNELKLHNKMNKTRYIYLNHVTELNSLHRLPPYDNESRKPDTSAVSLVFGGCILYSIFANVDRLWEVSVGSFSRREDLESKFWLTHVIEIPLNIRIDLYRKKHRNSHFKLIMCLAGSKMVPQKENLPPAGKHYKA